MNRHIYLNSGLYQVQSESQRLPHEDVGIVALVKRLLEFLQLPAGEICAGSPPLAAGTIFVWVPRVCNGGTMGKRERV